MKKSLLLLFVLIAQFSNAQNPDIKRAWHWYFGGRAGIDFSSGSAMLDTSGGLIISEGCASISDTSGNLLFYTNGKTIWNNSNDTMPNGIGLLGGANGSATQSSLIIPKPFSSNIYYVFTTDENENNGINGMRYTLVDMNLDNGKGDVVSSKKNVLLFAPCTEKLSAVNHCTDTSVWISGHKEGSNEFYSYLLTSQGLDTNPVISVSGGIISISQGIYSLAGQLKFSSDGRKAATPTNNRNWLELFDFDDQTGVFSNNMILSTNDTLNYGIEFSNDNKYLYNATTRGKLFQYDISSNDSTTIVNSKFLIFSFNITIPGLGQMQKAPDGKIYLGSSQVIHKSSVINNPNGGGYSCNFTDTSFFLGAYPHFNQLGLPNFNCSYFRTNSGSGCITAISELQNDFIKIFPNPARDWILLEGKGIRSVEITNALGSKIGSYPTTAFTLQHQINLSSLSCGIYFLKINMIDERFQFQKIIVQK